MNTILKNNRRLSLAIVAIIVLLTATQALAAAGSLDTTFGTNGIATADLGSSSDSFSDIVLQPDGKIVMMGSAKILMRYNSNGSLDNTFGANGKLNLDFGRSLAVQPDGKLLVAGSSQGSFAVARYNSNGTSLDNTFGTNGVAIIPSASGSLSDLAVESNGRIVVVGTWSNSQGHSVYSVIARLNSNGTLYDTDYGSIIWLDNVFSYPNYNFGEAVAVQSDGKIVVFGRTMDDESYSERPFLVRLNQNGSPDKSTFGTNGRGAVIIAVPRFHSDNGSMVIQADGRIVVAGTVGDSDDVHNDLIVARFNTNGTLDTTFGGTGIAVTDFGTNEFGMDVHLQTDGKIVVVGTSSTGDSSNLLIVRYNKDGSLDTAFGDNGKLIGGLGNGSSSGAAIAVRPNGKFLVAGSSNGDAFLARYDVSDAIGQSITINYESNKSYDGSILESGENSNTGGTIDRNAVTFNVGDDQKDRQYLGILSFNTSSIPDNALVTSAQVKIKKQGVKGADPMLTHGDLLLDMRNGFFSNNLALQAGDFAAPASPGTLPERFSSLTDNWYAVTLNDTNRGFISKTNVTQFRVRFSLDDNDDRGADYVKFYSGNSVEANRPQLIITYVLDSGNTSSMRQSSLPIVGGTNQPPTIASNGGSASASLNIQENTSAVTTITGTDPDLPTQSLTYSITGGADSEKFTINASSGTLTFISAPNFEIPTDVGANNIYDVTVQISDGSLTNSQAIAISVTNVNDAPVITGQSTLSTPEDTNLTITLTDLTVTDVDNIYPTSFTLTVLAGANYTFTDNTITPASNFNGTLTVPVKVNDGALDSNIFDLTVTVSAVNDAPVITGQSTLSTPEDANLAITLTDLTVTDVDNIYPTSFTLTVLAGANYTFTDNTITPASNFNGTLTVPVKVNDGALDSNIFDLTVTVSAVNDAPVITGQSTLSTPEDTNLAITLTDLTVTDVDNIYPTSFTLTVLAGANYTFTDNTITPASNFNGTLIVPVKVNDGVLDSNTFDLTVTVSAVNDAPVITGQSTLSTPEDTNLAITLTDLTVTDVDNIYPTSFTQTVLAGANYTFTDNTITPASNFNGTLTVPVKVNDGALDSNTFDLTVTVSAVNDAPVITGQSTLSTPEDTNLAITLTDLTVTDVDNIYPTGFTLTVLAGANYTFTDNTITPASNFNGTLTVPVKVNDGALDSNIFDLTVTVSAVNDAPVITSSASVSVTENSIAATTVTATDVDLPAQPLTYSILGGVDSALFTSPLPPVH